MTFQQSAKRGFTTLFYTFLHYTFAFFVYGVVKSVVKSYTKLQFFTLNYIFYTNLPKIFFFPIIFHQFSHKTFPKAKHTLCETKMTLNYTFRLFYTTTFTLFYTTLLPFYVWCKKCCDPPPPPAKVPTHP